MAGERIRLNRFLASSGLCSRRSAEHLVTAGRVRVNGAVCTDLGTTVEPEKDRVLLDGKRIFPSEKRIYLALHKPKGFLTTMRDERGRKTVKDLIGGVRGRVFPVGRLDRESEGILLFTNDGALAHRLLHPSFGVEKVYRVTLGRTPLPSQLERLKEGVLLEDGVATVLKVSRTRTSARTLVLTLREGKKREIRRIFAELKLPVVRLKRTSFGPVKLGTLEPGRWRELEKREVENLLAVARLEST
jgi:pseudouridine synthase